MILFWKLHGWFVKNAKTNFFGSGGNLAVNLKCLQQCIHKEQSCVNTHVLNYWNKALNSRKGWPWRLNECLRNIIREVIDRNTKNQHDLEVFLSLQWGVKTHLRQLFLCKLRWFLEFPERFVNDSKLLFVMLRSTQTQHKIIAV